MCWFFCLFCRFCIISRQNVLLAHPLLIVKCRHRQKADGQITEWMLLRAKAECHGRQNKNINKLNKYYYGKDYWN